MQILTPSGYVDIIDLNIGDDVIAYDINTGEQIINHLEGKTLWTPEMFPAEYTVGRYDEDGNYIDPVLVYTSYEVFQRIHGNWVFYRINNTWDLFREQSVWANMNVVHASDLQIGDVLYNDLDGDVTITSIEEVEVPSWWKLDVSGDSSYIADGLTLHNASRYWVGGGSSTNWNATANTNWSASSGGANNASVPTSADGVFFDNLGNSDSVISVGITVLSLSISSGYTATMTHNALLQVAGSVTFGANYTIAGTSTLQINAASTITSNGKTWPNSLILNVIATITLVGDLTIDGILYVGSYSTSPSVPVNKTTTETLIINGGLASSAGTSGLNYLSGTAALDFYGSTWSGVQVTNQMTNFETVTLSGTSAGSLGSFTNLGTINAGTSTFYMGGTVNSNGALWNNVVLNFSTVTINGSNLIVNGYFAASGGSNINKTTNEVVYANNGLTTFYNGSTFGGNATVYLRGGSWSTTQTITPFAMPIAIDGNITIGTNISHSGTLTYVSGIVTPVSSGILNLSGNQTLTFNAGANMQVPIILSGATKTLLGNFSTNSLVTVSVNTVVNKTTTETFTLSGGIFLNTKNISGTADVYLTGGTWSTNSFATFGNPLYINGNVTITGVSYYTGPLFRYLSGTVTTTGNNMVLASATCTLNTAGIVWNILSISGVGTYTLASSLTINGLFTNSGGTATINRTTTEVINANGGITNGSVTGTAVINFTGGTWISLTGNAISSPLNINGNIVISSTVYQGLGTLTYVSGTITGVSTPVLSLLNSTQTLSFNAGANMTVRMDFNGGTKTLLGNFSTAGLVGIIVTTIVNKTTTETFSLSGGITHINNIFLQGTAKLVAIAGDFYSFGGGGLQVDMDIAGNISINNNLTLTGIVGGRTLKYVSGTISGTGSLFINGLCNIDLNGVVIPYLYISGANNTLTSNAVCNKLLGGNGGLNRATNQTLTVYGDITTLNNGFQGNVIIIAKGGTITTGSTNFSLNTSLTLDGNITFAGNVLFYCCTTGDATSVLKYVSGTNNSSTTALTVQQPCSFDTAGISWASFTRAVGFSSPTNLISDLNILGATTITSTGVINSTTSAKLRTGGLPVTVAIGGTATIELTGGTWSSAANVYVTSPLTFNGNPTISGNVYYSTGTLGYISGTPIVAGSTLNVNANTTFNTGLMRWNNINMTGGAAHVLTSDLYALGTFVTNVGGGSNTNTSNGSKFYIYGGTNIGNQNGGNVTFVIRGGTYASAAFGGLMSPLELDGDITFQNSTVTGYSITYISGNINTAGSTLTVGGGTTMNTRGIVWNNVAIKDTITLTSDMFVNGLLSNLNGTFVNKTTNEVLYARGGYNVANFWMQGNGTIALQGGTWSGAAGTFTQLTLLINGNVTLGANANLGLNGTLAYRSGRILSGTLNLVNNCTVIDFHRCPIQSVIVTAGVTVTMNQFFTGTPTSAASITCLTAAGQYTVAFTDSFERIGKDVIISGCVLSRPMQLILSLPRKVNSLRSTNNGIRYINQSPNGFSKNTPTVTGLSTGPAAGLMGDPSFAKQL